MCIAYGVFVHGFHLQKNLSSVKRKPYYFTSKLCQFLHVCASLPRLETLMNSKHGLQYICILLQSMFVYIYILGYCCLVFEHCIM